MFNKTGPIIDWTSLKHYHRYNICILEEVDLHIIADLCHDHRLGKRVGKDNWLCVTPWEEGPDKKNGGLGQALFPTVYGSYLNPHSQPYETQSRLLLVAEEGTHAMLEWEVSPMFAPGTIIFSPIGAPFNKFGRPNVPNHLLEIMKLMVSSNAQWNRDTVQWATRQITDEETYVNHVTLHLASEWLRELLALRLVKRSGASSDVFVTSDISSADFTDVFGIEIKKAK